MDLKKEEIISIVKDLKDIIIILIHYFIKIYYI